MDFLGLWPTLIKKFGILCCQAIQLQLPKDKSKSMGITSFGNTSDRHMNLTARILSEFTAD